MNYKRCLIGLVMAFVVALLAGQASANNIAVTNVELHELKSDSYMLVDFDLSWENSWRIDNGGVTNWDAAWVFIKYLDANTNWHHAYLSTNDNYQSPADDSIINVGTSSNGTLGVGAFVYRDNCGSGTVNFTDIQLCWDISDVGVDLSPGSNQQISVHAIEMVYVPGGRFYVGDDASSGSLRETNTTAPALISSTNLVVQSSGTSYDDVQVKFWGGILVNGNDGIATNGYTTINNPDYPTGYKAFYCMKYEMSQGQYADFLNHLTSVDAPYRSNVGSANRHTISGSFTNFIASTPDRACGYLNWADGAAYSDWAGLRPMTELEYAKACRGPLFPVNGEYAWGTNTMMPDIGDGTIDVTSPEDGTEINTTDVSLGPGVHSSREIFLNGASNGFGPVRCGLFATSNSTRITSGGTYWGIMDMSGNVWEKPVTFGRIAGRTYTGLHGDGELGSNGFANVTKWPMSPDADGWGVRGGSWQNTQAHTPVSSRQYAAAAVQGRDLAHGFRSVRSAPSQSGVNSGGGVSPLKGVRFYGGSYDGYNNYHENPIISKVEFGSIIFIM